MDVPQAKWLFSESLGYKMIRFLKIVYVDCRWFIHKYLKKKRKKKADNNNILWRSSVIFRSLKRRIFLSAAAAATAPPSSQSSAVFQIPHWPWAVSSLAQQLIWPAFHCSTAQRITLGFIAAAVVVAMAAAAAAPTSAAGKSQLWPSRKNLKHHHEFIHTHIYTHIASQEQSLTYLLHPDTPPYTRM